MKRIYAHVNSFDPDNPPDYIIPLSHENCQRIMSSYSALMQIVRSWQHFAVRDLDVAFPEAYWSVDVEFTLGIEEKMVDMLHDSYFVADLGNKLDSYFRFEARAIIGAEGNIMIYDAKRSYRRTVLIDIREFEEAP
jgi:hypothetical protein